jgi:hypothetical protein
MSFSVFEALQPFGVLMSQSSNSLHRLDLCFAVNLSTNSLQYRSYPLSSYRHQLWSCVFKPYCIMEPEQHHRFHPYGHASAKGAATSKPVPCQDPGPGQCGQYCWAQLNVSLKHSTAWVALIIRVSLLWTSVSHSPHVPGISNGLIQKGLSASGHWSLSLSPVTLYARAVATCSEANRFQPLYSFR